MISRLFIILLFCFGLVTDVVAQNIGYFGKTNIIGAGIRLNNGIPVKNGGIAPVLMLERSISIQSSIKFGFSVEQTSLSFDSKPVYINALSEVFFPNAPYEFDLDFRNPLTGDFKANVSNFNLAWRNYAMSRGSMAPLGLFYEFGVNTSIVELTEVNGYTEGTYYREPILVKLGNVERMKSNFDFGFRFAIGEKRFIDKNQFLEYSVALTLDGFITDRSSFSSHMQAAHHLVKQKHILKSFFHINLIYGLAY